MADEPKITGSDLEEMAEEVTLIEAVGEGRKEAVELVVRDNTGEERKEVVDLFIRDNTFEEEADPPGVARQALFPYAVLGMVRDLGDGTCIVVSECPIGPGEFAKKGERRYLLPGRASAPREVDFTRPAIDPDPETGGEEAPA